MNRIHYFEINLKNRKHRSNNLKQFVKFKDVYFTSYKKNNKLTKKKEKSSKIISRDYKKMYL